MQKKILASLLLTGSMATPALAAYPVEDILKPDEWKNAEDGSAMGNSLVVGTTTVQVGAGMGNLALDQTVQLPAGTYWMRVESSDNVKVNVTGATVSDAKAPESEEYEYLLGFTVAGEGKVDVTIKISSADGMNGYSFDNAEIVLDFDKDKAVADMQAALDALTELGTVDTDREDIKDELDAKKAELEGEIADVQTQIDDLKEANEDFETYEKYGFNKPTNDIQAAINALTTAVDEYNADVEAENEAYQNKLVNEPKYNTLIAQADKLVEDIATLLGDIEDNTEYVKTNCLAEAEQLSTDINTYKEDIETAYADLYQEVDFASRTGLLQDRLDALQAEYDAVNADSQAYEEFMADYSDLTEYKDQCLAEIAEFEGITPYETVYNDITPTYVQQINNAYNNGIKNLTIEVGEEEGAAAKLEANKNIIASIKEQIETSFNNINGIVTGQNDKYETNRDNYRALQGRLTEEVTNPADPTIQALPQELRNLYTDEYGKAQTALQTLREELIAGYKAHTLNSDDYEAAYTAAVDAIDNAKNWKDAHLNPILDAQNALNGLKEYIEQYTADTYPDLPVQYDVYTKFEDSVQSVQTSIDNMIAGVADGSISDSELKTLSAALIDTVDNSLKPSAKEMIDAFGTAYDSISAINDAIETLKAQVDAKESVAGADLLKTSYTTNVVVPFSTELSTLTNEFNAAWALPGQECYNAAVELGETIKNDNLLQRVETAQLDFAKTRTEFNQTAVNKRFETAKKNADDLALEAGYDTIDFTDADEAKTDADDAVAAATTVDDYTDADTLLQEAINALTPVEAQIKKVSDNAKAYHDVLEPLEDNVQKVLNDLDDYIFGKATEQAAADYYGMPNGLVGKLNDRLTAAKENDEAEYNDLTAAENQATLEGVLNGIITDANKLKDAFDANEAAHNNQNNVLQGVADQINQAIENVDNNNVDFISDDELAQQYKQDARDLLEELMGVDQQISDAYRGGESVEKNQELLDAIADIEERFNDLMEKYGDEYHKEVVKVNNQTVADSDWNKAIADAKTAYLKGVEAYNVYRFGITNENYRNFPQVAETLDKYAELFQNTTELNNLIAQMKADLQNKNSKNILMTADDMAAWAGKVNDLAESINDAIAQMDLDMVAAADAYYDQRVVEVKENLDQAERELMAAGITDAEIRLEIVKEAQDYYLDAVLAQKPYATNLQVKGVEYPGTVMNGIANLFDQSLKALNDETLQKAGEDYWANEYNKVVEALNKLDSTIAESTAADLGVRQDASDVYEEAQGELTDLNDTATADDTILDDLQDYTDQLKDILDKITAATNEVEASQKANTDLANLKKQYNDIEIPIFNSRLDALKDYVATLGGGQTPAAQAGIANVVTQIAALQNAVNVANTTTGKQNVEVADQAVRDAFTAAYKAAKEAEKAYLNQLCDDLVVSFQNSVDYANGAIDITAEDAFNKQIVELRNKVFDLSPYADNASFASAAVELEKEICDLMVDVEKWYPADVETTLDTANAEVKEAYEAAEAAFNAEKEAFDSYEDVVKEKYGDQLAAIEATLNNAKENWDNMGNLVIAQAPNLEAAFTEVQDKLKEFAPVAEAFNNQVVLNNEIYATLSDGITVLEGKVQEVNEALEQYPSVYNEWYVSEQLTQNAGDIADLNNEIVADNKEYDLNEDKEDSYQQQIDAYKMQLNYLMALQLDGNYCYKQHGELQSAIGELYNALYSTPKNQGVVPAVKAELEQKYNEAQWALWDAESQYSDIIRFFSDNNYSPSTDSYTIYVYENNARATIVVTKTYAQLVEEFKNLLDSMAALVEDLRTDLETAQENTYLLGDVVNPQDKTVNVADVQQLIKWVGEDMTLEKIGQQEGPVVECAADVNRSGKLNIADVTTAVSAAINKNWATERMAMRMAKLNGGDSSIELKYMGESNGVSSYAVVLTNATAFAGGQFDLKLTDGLELVETSTATATENHNLFAYDNAQGARLIIASFENDEISVNAGTIAVIEVKGNGKIGLENAIFADAIGQEYELRSGNATMIDQIIDGANAVKEAVYDAAGRVLNKVQRGINIIRNSDGTVTKEMRRK